MAAAEASIEELELSDPPCLHTISAFLSMEPPDVVISFARDCGKGLITERLQHFIWIHCINRTDVKPYPPYLRSFLKKLIFEIESSGEVVIDELYEKYVYQTSMKGSVSVKENERLSKRISFLFPRDCSNLPSCPKSRKLEVLLHCSVNLLEGDTGCSIWPSCLFLSEFILSFPEIFANKSCFEVGSGVGLVGICLAHVKASKVILSDGDLLTLANMKLNLESNKITARNHLLDHTIDSNTVQCLHLPWESAAENGLQQINPDIVIVWVQMLFMIHCVCHTLFESWPFFLTKIAVMMDLWVNQHEIMSRMMQICRMDSQGCLLLILLLWFVISTHLIVFLP
ncbi:unnamed protein product [Cuscuta europaea]|uniref:FAM86 N-terminal domain-containing protein n=1 Tax=Cuscuta europaea TaxID=41803 RepID=A0A9P0Z4Y0_CUSEU|nr:unnamed protein product [Cuscuta europaea]